jgi:pimeloyl-ACP methyl ester carboxylesterase
MPEPLPQPETRYVETDGMSIAYQVFGSGAQDLVLIPGIVSHLDAQWQEEASARLLRRLARSFRVICFDKRGQGLSDRFEGVPTLEQRMDDVRAVMQAAGSAKAVLFAYSEGGAMGALYTATHPALVERLVMIASMARFCRAPDYPHMPPLARVLAGVADTWGSAASAALFAPSRSGDAAFCERLARFQRQTASPSAMRRLIVANEQIDVRAILPQIRRPTLIIQRRDDRIVRRGNGRYLADQVPDAVYLELPGEDHLLFEGDMESVVDAVARFAAADRVRIDEPHAGRRLATVLFTDIVGSTEIAGRLGDAAWRDLLQRFLALGRQQLQAHRGREVDSAGDGLFALFDGPARAMRCAATMVRELQAIGVSIRAGVHTGEVEPLGDKVSGLAVHIGARVMALAGAGQVWASATSKDLVAGSGIAFEPCGSQVLKGVPGEWPLYRARVPETA